MGGHLGYCFHSLAITNSAATNMSTDVELFNRVVSFFLDIPSSTMAGSYGSSAFSCLRNAVATPPSIMCNGSFFFFLVPVSEHNCAFDVHFHD